MDEGYIRSLRESGDYAAADRELSRALAEAEGRAGPHAPELIPLLNEMGMVNKYLGDFARAGDAYRRAMAILAQHHDQPAIRATLLHNLAGLAHAQGDARRAEALARQGIAHRERYAGRDSLAYSADLAALAAILVDLGEVAEAHDALTEVLDRFQREFGPEHAEVAVVLHNLGSLQYRMGDFLTAATTLHRAARLKSLSLGPSHPELGITLHNLGCAQLRVGREAQAIGSLRRALRILEHSVLPDHPALVSCRRRLAQLDAASAPHQPAESQ